METVLEVRRMRRTSPWVGWALCLCASLAVSAQDYIEEDELVLDPVRDDGTRPESGAEFLRCNKVRTVPEALERASSPERQRRVMAPVPE